MSNGKGMKVPTESENKFTHSAVAIVPASDLDAAQAFYEKLGFAATSVYHAHGIYFYSENVEALAARVGTRARSMPWGMKEFAVSDPDGTLVRVGWPV